MHQLNTAHQFAAAAHSRTKSTLCWMKPCDQLPDS